MPKKKKQQRNGFFSGFSVPKAKPVGFDQAFGLDFDFRNKLDTPENPHQLFQDFGFTDQFKSSIEEDAMIENDPFVPEAISNNFDEPDEQMFTPKQDRNESLKETLLFEQLPKIRLGNRIPKSDPDIPRKTKLERKFRRVRQEALATGGNPLDAEEEMEFESESKFTRNFGTSARVPTGMGFGRL